MPLRIQFQDDKAHNKRIRHGGNCLQVHTIACVRETSSRYGVQLKIFGTAQNAFVQHEMLFDGHLKNFI